MPPLALALQGDWTPTPLVDPRHWVCFLNATMIQWNYVSCCYSFNN